MDVKKILEEESQEEINKTLAELSGESDQSSIETIKQFLLFRDSGQYGKHITPRIACLAMLQKGRQGIDALVSILPQAPGAGYPRSIVEALWYASEGQLPKHLFVNYTSLLPPLTKPLPPSTTEAAGVALDELILRSLEEEPLFDVIVGFLHLSQIANVIYTDDERKRFRARVFDVFTKGRIQITDDLICRFDEIVKSKENEEAYQTFLSKHPVFLDPLASEVFPKHRLGSDLITDFVIRRLDNKYILVEIEKPHDAVFTSGDDFSSKFTHAFGQVLDFQQWIDSHGEYARAKLPEISSPRGLVIIGSAAEFSEDQKKKLHRFNMNSSTVQVLTFDEVSLNARRLYLNIHRR